MVYEYWNYDQGVKWIEIGYLLKKIFDDSLAKIEGHLNPSKRKMFLYSSHESTLGCMLNGLKLIEKAHIPPYGSAILFDLRKDSQNNYYMQVSLSHIVFLWMKIDCTLQIRYENDLDRLPETLNIPGCGILCPIKQFMSIYDDLIPKIDIKQLCNNDR